MVKTILSQVKEYKRVSILTPVCMLGEVIMEMIIPLLMASIIDKGVSAGDIHHIKITGLIMLLMAAISLTLGILSARFGAQASAGLAKNLRQAMFEKVQTFSFSNLDKFSTSSLITRLTTDVTNVQNAYMMILRMCTRAPATMLIAMVLSFAINGRLASVYLVAVVVLGLLLFLIMSKAMRYFKEVFQKYDDLNASVQENISGIRVVDSDHILNILLELKGKLPEDKDKMLGLIDYLLDLPQEQQDIFRLGRRLGLMGELRDLHNEVLVDKVKRTMEQSQVDHSNLDAVCDRLMSRAIPL